MFLGIFATSTHFHTGSSAMSCISTTTCDTSSSKSVFPSLFCFPRLFLFSLLFLVLFFFFVVASNIFQFLTVMCCEIIIWSKFGGF